MKRNNTFNIIILLTFLLAPQVSIFPSVEASLYADKQNQEHLLVEHFVTCTMSWHYGIYTLFGVKPITEFCIEYDPSGEAGKKKSEEEEEPPTFTIFYDDSSYTPWSTSRKKQWVAFKKKIDSMFLKEHFFIEYRFNHTDKNNNAVLFVHEPSLIELLNSHHPLFEQRLGEKFDTLEKVMELKNGGSYFWDKIFKDKNHYLMGLLFGFEEENSKAFQLEVEGNENIANRRRFHTSIEETKNSLQNISDLQDVCIPAFVSYSKEGEDEIVEKYCKNRKIIQQYMKDKNLKEETLRILELGHSALTKR